jgi:hypothetical protein
MAKSIEENKDDLDIVYENVFKTTVKDALDVVYESLKQHVEQLLSSKKTTTQKIEEFETEMETVLETAIEEILSNHKNILTNKVNEMKASIKGKKEKKEKKEKKLKDPEAPKKALSGYIIFTTEYRKSKKLKNMSPTEKMKACGKKWKSMSDDEKKPYLKESENQKKRYKEEMEDYVRPSDEELAELDVNKKKKRSPKSPKSDEEKKPPTAYMLFAKEKRAELMRKADFDKSTSVSIIASMWKKIKDTEEATPFIEQANRLKKTDVRVPSVNAKKSVKKVEKEEEEEEQEEEEEEEEDDDKPAKKVEKKADAKKAEQVESE